MALPPGAREAPRFVTSSSIVRFPHTSRLGGFNPRTSPNQHSKVVLLYRRTLLTVKDKEMPKKRRSRGRSKGGKGRSELIQCSNCGMLTPRDKMKRVTSWVSLVEPSLAKELRARGAYIARQRVMKNLCVSCAVHFGVSKVRSREERRF